MTEKQIYRLSRVILTLIFLILAQVCLINEDISFKILAFVYTAIVYLMSFISTYFCKKIISLGNKLKNKILFYVLFPIIIVAFVLISYITAVALVIEPLTNTMAGWDGLGIVIIFLGIAILFAVACMLPYIQALIVLSLNKLIRRQ